MTVLNTLLCIRLSRRPLQMFVGACRHADIPVVVRRCVIINNIVTVGIIGGSSSSNHATTSVVPERLRFKVMSRIASSKKGVEVVS